MPDLARRKQDGCRRLSDTITSTDSQTFNIFHPAGTNQIQCSADYGLRSEDSTADGPRMQSRHSTRTARWFRYANGLYRTSRRTPVHGIRYQPDQGRTNSGFVP